MVRDRETVPQFLSVVKKALLVGRDSLFILNFSFEVVDSVVGLNGQCYGLVGEGPDKKGLLPNEGGFDWSSLKQRTEFLALA